MTAALPKSVQPFIDPIGFGIRETIGGASKRPKIETPQVTKPQQEDEKKKLEEAAAAEKEKARRRTGRTKTVLTSPLGARGEGAGQVQRRTLLG